MKKDIQNLIQVSKKIGGYPAFVQGGGGNISVKINEYLMVIKASGYWLKDMAEDNGISFVNYADISHYIKSNKILDVTEEGLSVFIKDKMVPMGNDKMLRPSIETGFHSLLEAKYIIHTHSVYVNILCCTEEGKGILRKLFPKAVYVIYANPGRAITMEIARAMKTKKADIIFMQNHGIVVCSDDAEEGLAKHQIINEKIMEYFHIDSVYQLEKVCVNKIRDNVIFPDQVVYAMSGHLSNTQAGQETLCAYDYIIKKVADLGLHLNMIAKEDVEYIKNMESEKYRKSLIKK